MSLHFPTPNQGDHEMKRFKKILAVAFLLTYAMGGAAGCNTVRGAGKDIEKGGEAIQDASDNAQK
jgi:predicted small secreted protein